MAGKGSEQMKSNLVCVDKLWNLVWEVVGAKALGRGNMNLHKVRQEKSIENYCICTDYPNLQYRWTTSGWGLEYPGDLIFTWHVPDMLPSHPLLVTFVNSIPDYMDHGSNPVWPFLRLSAFKLYYASKKDQLIRFDARKLWPLWTLPDSGQYQKR